MSAETVQQLKLTGTSSHGYKVMDLIYKSTNGLLQNYSLPSDLA